MTVSERVKKSPEDNKLITNNNLRQKQQKQRTTN